MHPHAQQRWKPEVFHCKNWHSNTMHTFYMEDWLQKKHKYKVKSISINMTMNTLPDASWTFSSAVDTLAPAPLSKSSSFLFPMVFMYLLIIEVIYKPSFQIDQDPKEKKNLYLAVEIYKNGN